jgi:hypothetical protein
MTQVAAKTQQDPARLVVEPPPERQQTDTTAARTKAPGDTFDPLVPPHKDQGQKELSPYEAAKKIHAGFYGAKTDWTAVFQGMQGQSFDQVAEHYEVFNQDFKFDLLHHAPAGPIADAIQHFIDGDQVAMLASRIKANLDANPPNLGDIEGILATASPDLALAVAQSFDAQYRNDLPSGPTHPTDFLRESLVNARPGLIGKWDPTRFLSVTKSLEAAKHHETQPLSVKANQAEADATAASLQANKGKTFELINQLSPEQRLLLSKNEGFKAQIRETLGAETPDFHLAMATLYNDKPAITAAKIEKMLGPPSDGPKIIETLFNLKPQERLAVSKAFERFKHEPPRVPPETLEQAIARSIGGDPVIGHLTTGAVNDVILGAEILHWALFSSNPPNVEMIRTQLVGKEKHWTDQVAAKYAEIYDGANLKEDLISKLSPPEKLELVDQAYDLGKPKNAAEAAQRMQDRLNQVSDIFGNLADKVSQLATNSSPLKLMGQQIVRAQDAAKAGDEAGAQAILDAIQPDLVSFVGSREAFAHALTDYATIGAGVVLGFTGVGIVAVAALAVAGAVAKPLIDKLVNGNKATFEKLITDAGYGAFLGGTAFLPAKMVGDFVAAIKGQALLHSDELATIIGPSTKFRALISTDAANPLPSLGAGAPWAARSVNTDEFFWANTLKKVEGARVQAWDLPDGSRALIATLPSGERRGAIFTKEGAGVDHFRFGDDGLETMPAPPPGERQPWIQDPEVKGWIDLKNTQPEALENYRIADFKKEVPQNYRTMTLDEQGAIWYRNPGGGFVAEQKGATMYFNAKGTETWESVDSLIDPLLPSAKEMKDFLSNTIKSYKPSAFGEASAYGPEALGGNPAMNMTRLKEAGFEGEPHRLHKQFSDGSEVVIYWNKDEATGILQPWRMAWKSPDGSRAYINLADGGTLKHNLEGALIVETTLPREITQRFAGQDVVNNAGIFFKNPENADIALANPILRGSAFKDPWQLANDLKAKGYAIEIGRSGKTTSFEATIKNGEAHQRVIWSLDEKGGMGNAKIKTYDSASHSSADVTIDTRTGKIAVDHNINGEIYGLPEAGFPASPPTDPILLSLHGHPALEPPWLGQAGKITPDLLELDPASALLELRARGMPTSAFEISQTKVVVNEKLGDITRSLTWERTSADAVPGKGTLSTTHSSGANHNVTVDMIGGEVTSAGAAFGDLPGIFEVTAGMIGARPGTWLGDFSFLRGSSEQVKNALTQRGFDIRPTVEGFEASKTGDGITQSVKWIEPEGSDPFIRASFSGPRGDVVIVASGADKSFSRSSSTTVHQAPPKPDDASPLAPPPKDEPPPPPPEPVGETYVAPKADDLTIAEMKIRNKSSENIFKVLEEAGVEPRRLIRGPGDLIDPTTGEVFAWERIELELTKKGWTLVREPNDVTTYVLESHPGIYKSKDGLKDGQAYFKVSIDRNNKISYQGKTANSSKNDDFTLHSITSLASDSKPQVNPILQGWDDLFMEKQPSGYHFPERYRIKDREIFERLVPPESSLRYEDPTATGIFVNKVDGSFVHEDSKGRLAFYEASGDRVATDFIRIAKSDDGMDRILSLDPEAPAMWRRS